MLAATGGRALGLTVEQRPVFYLALEDGDRRMQDRCRTLLGHAPIPDAFDYLTKLERPGTVIPTITAWLDQHADQAPLVILDTLGKVMPPALNNETTYQRDYRIGSALKRIVDDRPGSALTTNHHDRKAATDDFEVRYVYPKVDFFDEDRPRRGRPPKRLVELRRAREEALKAS